MWPFTRKPKPLNPGPINEDWKAGDLAQHFVNGKWQDGVGPDYMDVCTVTRVATGIGNVSQSLGWGLGLKGFVDLFDSNHFRKVPPLNSAATAEFTAQIKALKPKRVKA